MTHRIISGLQSCRMLDYESRPSFARGKRKAKGSRAKGHTYERAVGRHLVRRGLKPILSQWWEFIDSEGIGHAETDAFIVGRAGIILIEVKLTQTLNAFLQMSQLYVPLLEAHYQLPVYTLQVCKGLKTKPKHPATPWDIARSLKPANYTWHLPNP